MYSGYKFLLNVYTTDFISKFASHPSTLPKSYFNEHLFQCCLKHPSLPFCARNILCCKSSHIPHSHKYPVILEEHFRSFNAVFFIYQGKIILQLILVYSVRQGLRFFFFFRMTSTSVVGKLNEKPCLPNYSSIFIKICREPVRHSARDKGHEEGGSAYAKAGSSLRSPPGYSQAFSPQKTRVCLLYCFVLSPLTLLGAVPYHHLALSLSKS